MWMMLIVTRIKSSCLQLMTSSCQDQLNAESKVFGNGKVCSIESLKNVPRVLQTVIVAKFPRP